MRRAEIAIVAEEKIATDKMRGLSRYYEVSM